MRISCRDRAHDLWRRHVNPDHARLLEVFDFGRCFVGARGTRLVDEEGREYVDFLSGYGVHSIGHNHERLVRRLRETLDACEPSMLHVDAPLAAGELAERLTAVSHPDLCRVAFASSGAEAVEAALKAARAATGRRPLIACEGGYHGLTVGALSLMGHESMRRPFGEFLPDVVHVPFGDVGGIRDACARHRPAAFVVEPIQAEGGIRIPSPDYLVGAAHACAEAGCLLVVDEIQTGLGRTGNLFATDFTRVVPDVLLVGKALSGGTVPVAATLLSRDTWERAFSGATRCHLCASTFSGGRLAMAAGLETLRIVEEERLAERAADLGRFLLDGLRELSRRHPVIREVRGQGLLAGIEFDDRAGLLGALVPEWARRQLFAQVVAALLLRDHAFVTQPCGLAPQVLRVEPPLVVSREEIAAFVAALDETLEACPTQGSALVGAFRKAVLGMKL